MKQSVSDVIQLDVCVGGDAVLPYCLHFWSDIYTHVNLFVTIGVDEVSENLCRCPLFLPVFVCGMQTVL
jgi:hypothetical protein